MKNGVERYKDFFCYFNALKTNCAKSIENPLLASEKTSQTVVLDLIKIDMDLQNYTIKKIIQLN